MILLFCVAWCISAAWFYSGLNTEYADEGFEPNKVSNLVESFLMSATLVLVLSAWIW